MYRNRRLGVFFVGLVAAAAFGVTTASAQDADPVDPPECGVEFADYSREPVATGQQVLADQPIVMSDGVTLYADVTLPTGVDGPFPVSLTITGYNKSILGPIGLGGADQSSLTSHGYAVVLVDDRGTGTSEGAWDSWGARTRADYPEILDWIVAQDWSDGRIGVTGGSYLGITSLFAAASGHEAVDGVFAVVPMGDAYRDIVFQGGQVNASFIPLWMGLVTGLSAVPNGSDPSVIVDHLLNVTDFQLTTLLDAAIGGATAYDGPFWHQRSPLAAADAIEAPTFIVGGLDDLFQRGEPMLYEALADHTDARLLIGPWTHVASGSGLPADGVPGLGSLLLQWFDHHVMGLDAGADCIPPVTQYHVGAEEYRTAPSWPVPDLHAERWYLRGDDSLTADPPGDEGSDTYLQLPVNGLCTRSMNQWLAGLLDAIEGCGDDNSLDESLALTWTTEPFTEPTTINGPIQADLWLQTTLGSEALTSVAVSIVGPDGVSRGVSNGQLALSHRAVDPDRSRFLDGQSIQPWHPFTEQAAQPVPTGEPVLAQVEVFPTSVEIPAGSSLRVTVAAYDVPHALPSAPMALAAAAGPVDVLHTAEHPSSIVLPVVGAGASPAVHGGVAAPAPGGAATGTASTSLPATGASTPLAAALGLLVLAGVVAHYRWVGVAP